MIVSMRILIGLLVLALLSTAFAQRPDCPVKDAPMPMRPPGPPPTVNPVFEPPARFDDPVKAPPRMVMPPVPAETPVEEGWVSEPLRLAGLAKSEPGPGAALSKRMAGLRDWTLVGFVAMPGGNDLIRVFERNRSYLVHEVLDMKSMGATIAGSPPPNAEAGRFPASRTARRSPSGCTLAILSWDADGVMHSLRLAGPQDLEQQHRTLSEVAATLAAR